MKLNLIFEISEFKRLIFSFTEYEFRVAGINNVGPGQEAIALYLTPEGMPTDSPKNITTRFQTPDVIEISYDPPPEDARNGQVGPNFEKKILFTKKYFSNEKFREFNEGNKRKTQK